MADVLLSLKPKYASLIWSGEKCYEFRKSYPKNMDLAVDKVYVYESGTGLVTGWFKVKQILSGSVDVIWNLTKDKSGVSEDAFREYFKNSKTCYAWSVGAKFHKEGVHCTLADLAVARAPQSYQYIMSLWDKVVANGNEAESL